MGLIDSFLLVGIFVIGMPVCWLIGAVLGKVLGVRWLARAFATLFFIAMAAGIPLAQRFFGVETQGRVVGKHETIHIAWRSGLVTDRLQLDVRYVPQHIERADQVMRSVTGDSLTIGMSASPAVYDRATMGSLTNVVYVSFRPSLARLKDRGIGDVFADLATAARGLLAPLRPGSVPNVPLAATARVVRVARRTSGAGGSRHPLAQPYDIVEVEFTPRGYSEPVHATDAIDAGSLAGLTAGATVPIHYAADPVRTIRLDGGTREYRRKNAWGTMREIGLIVLIVGVVIAFDYRRRSRRRRQAPRTV